MSLSAWAWAAPHLGFPAFDPVALALAIGGALLPDIDHPQSWVGRRARLISQPLAALIGHRGFTHSILAVIACGLLLR
jgi:inner membrane protein